MKCRYRIPLALVFLAITVTACSVIKNLFNDRNAPSIFVELISIDRLNLDRYDKPHSVEVRLYQLNKIDKFTAIDFRSLWTDAEASLGDDLIEVKQLIVLPETHHVRDFPQDPEANYLGVAAGYIRPRDNLTRAWISLENSRKLVVGLFQDHISLEASE